MTTGNGRVMVVAAHPDDPEFLAGGTVARLAEEGREITYVILTNGNKGSRHRDHRITGRVVLDCVYPLARDHLSFPELLPEYEPHTVREVYLIQWEQPDLVMDITGTMELKLAAIRCHASQVGDFKTVEARMRNRAAALGKEKGYSFAEGFDRVIVPG